LTSQVPANSRSLTYQAPVAPEGITDAHPVPSEPAPASFARSASIVALALVASRLLGLVREIVLANRFGTSSDFDAYVSAFRIPDLLFLVIMSGAFGSAFIPVFAGFLTHDDRHGAWRLASAVITYTALITVALGALAFVFADPLMGYVVAPHLPPDAHDLAVRTMRLLLLSPLLLGMGIAAKGILEAQYQFTLPALAPVVYNLAIVAAAIVLAPRYGITGVVAGVIAGAALHVTIQVPGLIRTGMVFRPTLAPLTPGLAEVGYLLLPRIVGQAAFQINFVAVNHFASGAGEGSVSGLNYAWQMMMLPNGVLALSISTVVFPTLTRQFERRDLSGFRSTFMDALKPLLFLLLPASIGLFVFRTSIFQAVFETGNFTSESTVLSANPLAFFALGLIFYGLVEILARTFYAMKDSRTPVAAGIIIIVFNIVLSAAVVDRFGHAGLAMSLSLSTGLEAVILLAILERRLGRLPRSFGIWIMKIIVATAVMACVAELLRPNLDRVTAGDTAPQIIQIFMLSMAVLISGIVYFAAAMALRLPEANSMLSMLRRRLLALLRR
jgi:putative peptidoglycan lipid II flippase